MKKKREKKSISTENLTDNEGNRSITKKHHAPFHTGTRPTLDESFISWTMIMPLFGCMLSSCEALIKSLTNYLSYV